MSEYDPHKDSHGSWSHAIAAQRLAFALNRAADEFGTPLPAGLAMFQATRLVKDIPSILEAVAAASDGRVK